MAHQGIVERIPQLNAVSEGFVASLQTIISAGQRDLAQRRALEVLVRELEPKTLTISEKGEDGRWYITKFYQEGYPLFDKVNKEVPRYGLTYVAEREEKTVFWDTNKMIPDHREWFVCPYHFGVPVRLSSCSGVAEVFVLGFDEEIRFVDESAVIAGIVASAYSSVIEGNASLDRGIEIGRVIEQERMAQQLHDDAVQKIFACQCAVKTMIAREGHDEDLSRGLSDLFDMLTEINRDLRQLLAEKKDGADREGDLGITGLFEAESERHLSLGGCPTAVFVPDELTVNSMVAAVIESVIRESLANIRKHAEAQSAILTCDVADGHLTVCVQDDGVGISGMSVVMGDAPHFGLKNMRHLADKIGGSVGIGPNDDGKGTCVRLSVPFR